MEPPTPDPRLTRLDRLRDSRGWSFSGPVGGFAATAVAGFDPVGQVFGTTVTYLGPPGLGRCFVPSSTSAAGDARTTANPHNRLLGKLKAARELALERAVAECQALGGDGIIEMRASVSNFFSQTVQFTIEGTAVRARSQTRPDAPFTTHLSGQDLARLLRSGWMPCALVLGMAIAACHFDDTMYRQTRRDLAAAGNREVSGYTRIVNDARHAARTALQNAAREQGGEGVVAHEATLHFTERECPLFDQRADYVVEATILGSAIVPLDRSALTAQRTPLTIMRLDRPHTTTPEAELRSASAPGPGPGPDTVPSPTLADRAFAYWSGRQARPSPDSD